MAQIFCSNVSGGFYCMKLQVVQNVDVQFENEW